METYRSTVRDFYAKMAEGVLAGQQCKQCVDKRYMYVGFCDKCGSADLEDIELGREGELIIFAPIGDTRPEFSEFSTFNGVKLKDLSEKDGFERTPATTEYVWGEVILDDGPSLDCFVKGLGVLYNEDLLPELKKLPRRVHVNIQEVAGNAIPVAEIID